MRALVRSALVLVVSAVLGACTSGAGPAATPSASPAPTSPAQPTASPAAGLFLRAMMTQAIAPIERFAWLPVVAITGDGVVVAPGPQMEIYPGPLLPSLIGRTITQAGQARIEEAARELGLLSGETDFTGGDVLMGGMQGRLQLVVGGAPLELIGDPGRLVRCGDPGRCVPTPGTPEAFAAFWQQLLELGTWMPEELGPEAPWEAASYGLLIGNTPEPGELPQGAPMDWPLDLPLASAGTPVGDGGERCLTVAGDDAVTLRPALQAANQLTAWVQDPGADTTFGLTVRPMLPGEDVCAETFGIHG